MDRIIYVAGCDKEGGIYSVRLCDDGKCEIINKTPCDRPMFLAKENGYLYVTIHGDDEGVIGRYKIGENGALSDYEELGTSGGLCSCHICVNNGDVYSANYVSGSISKVSGKVVQYEGGGVNLPRQDGPHAHFVCVTPDKKYLMAVNLGNDTVYTYDLALNEISTAKVPDGEGCRHLAFSDDGKICYCANELKSSVTVFLYDDGVLTRKETYSTLPSDFAEKNTVAAIRYKDGYLYITNRGHNSVAIFKASGEKLVRENIAGIGGNFPRDMDIFGDIMVVTNQHTNDVTFLKIEGSDAELLESKLEIPNPLCVIE